MRQSVRIAFVASYLSACSVLAAPEGSAAAIARAKLYADRIAILAEKYRDVPNYYAVKRWETSQFELALQALAASSTPSNAPGRHLEAYIDDVDESVQPFWVYIPEKPAAKPGLLVFLHGYSSTIDRFCPSVRMPRLSA